MDDEVANQIFAVQYMTLFAIVWLAIWPYAGWRRRATWSDLRQGLHKGAEWKAGRQ